MITISLCMIVKNEEDVLARCLDSLRGLMDEIIIVDTGSTDNTKEVALKYTDKVYDFSWCDDFAAARNFSFSKATKEYIYAPDADEVLDETNRRRFAMLKAALLEEIEIVTMKYITPDEFNTVQNANCDIRPKLYKRLRTFTWINPVHETVRLDPIIYDSDIEIKHLPQSMHGKRDFTIFKKSYEKNGYLPESIVTMYAKELLKCGSPEDFDDAAAFFERLIIVPFTKSIPEGQRNLNIAEELFEERDYILTWAIKGLKRLVENNFVFSLTKESKDVLLLYKSRYCPEQVFFEKYLEFKEDSLISRVEVQKRYEEFAYKRNLNVKSHDILNYITLNYSQVKLERKRINGSKNPIAVYEGLAFTK